MSRPASPFRALTVGRRDGASAHCATGRERPRDAGDSGGGPGVLRQRRDRAGDRRSAGGLPLPRIRSPLPSSRAASSISASRPPTSATTASSSASARRRSRAGAWSGPSSRRCSSSRSCRSPCSSVSRRSSSAGRHRPVPRPLLFVGAVLLGTLAFAGLGLLLAGTLRAEATLALANGLFLVFLMVGGIVLPVDHLPGADRDRRWTPARGRAVGPAPGGAGRSGRRGRAADRARSVGHCGCRPRGPDVPLGIDPLGAGRAESRGGGQPSKRRKIATAFWPPNPKPLIIAVSTRSFRFTFGV